MDSINIDWNAVLAITTVVMTLAIIATAIYAAIQLEDIKKSRHSSLLMQLIQAWDSEDNIESRKILNVYCEGLPFDEAAKKLAQDVKVLDEENADKYYAIVRLANFFENLGYLTCERHLDRKNSLELFGSAATKYWLLMKDITYYKRTQSDKPQADIWKYFEYIGNGCNKKDTCLKIKPAAFT